MQTYCLTLCFADNLTIRLKHLVYILGLCKRQKVVVEQKEPYTEIFIARGERFNA